MRRAGAPTGLALAVAVSAALAACTSGDPGGGAPATAPPSAGGAPSSGTAPSTGTAPSAGPGPAAWLGYHADPARTGAVDGGPSPGSARVAWRARLGGAVRGQPLVAGGRIVAATETNRVVALDPGTGRVLWSTSLGRPLTDVAATAGCGNIDPLGVTSTGVIDPATGTVYVVGEISDGHGGVRHRLVGLDLRTGRIRVSAGVDPPLPRGESPVHLLQRASLALGHGRVYVPYGGNLGDCGSYSGWVVGADVTDPARQVSFRVATNGQGGAIWQGGGAPALDEDGNVYVSTGNANPFPADAPDPVRYAESVVKLSPDLRVLASFKDAVAGGDLDLSTGNPVLLPDGELFAVGKTDIGYLLRRADLRPLAEVHGVCGSDPDGGPAYDPATGRVFVPCRGGGVQVVDVPGRRLGPRLAGADSAPVVVGGTVWALDTGSGRLVAFDAASGTRRQSVAVGADVPVFESPTAALGMLLVGTDDGVVAVR
jgi:outer membrane protein assembly factor BamB